MIAVLGPTAAGKTETAIEIATRLEAEVISVDSMQVYRGMDIGTAKPTLLERRGVVHHMIDVVDPEAGFTVAEFRLMGRRILDHAEHPIVICGGSGLHFRALVDPMSFAPTDPAVREELEAADPGHLRQELFRADPDAPAHVDVSNPRRVLRAIEILRLTGQTPSARAASAEADELRRYVSEVDFAAVGLDPGELLNDRIDARLRGMRSGGLVDEVRRLKDRLGRTARGAVGYREVLSYLAGELSEAEAFEEAARKTKKLARRQRTWFQRDPRIRWIPWLDDATARAERALEAI